jgi:hypothetical protein
MPEFNASGQIKAVITSVRDITEIQKAEEKVAGASITLSKDF